MTEFSLPGGRKLVVGKRKARIINPAWEYVEKVPMDNLSMGYGRPRRSAFYIPDRDDFSTLVKEEFIDYRHQVTTRWTWAIPDPATLEFIVETLDGRPVVEIGAGNGYWAWMLSQYGVDVVAYDIYPVGHEESWYLDKYIEERGKWEDVKAQEYFPVQEGGPEMLSLLDDCTERVLFLCWPNYDTDFAYDAVKAFRGDTVIYIGEGESGCTANWKFWALMHEQDPEYPPWGMPADAEPISQEWEEVASHGIEQWFGINDYVAVYKRKR